MKKIVLTSVLFISALILTAANINESSVPDNVKTFVTNSYPKARNIEWDKNKDTYKAVFFINGLKTEMEISSTGELSSLIEGLFIKDLPQNIVSYMKTNYPQGEIQGGTKIVKGQSVTYKVEISVIDKKGKIKTQTLSFDDKGNILKS